MEDLGIAFCNLKHLSTGTIIHFLIFLWWTDLRDIELTLRLESTFSKRLENPSAVINWLVCQITYEGDYFGLRPWFGQISCTFKGLSCDICVNTPVESPHDGIHRSDNLRTVLSHIFDHSWGCKASFNPARADSIECHSLLSQTFVHTQRSDQSDITKFRGAVKWEIGHTVESCCRRGHDKCAAGCRLVGSEIMDCKVCSVQRTIFIDVNSFESWFRRCFASFDLNWFCDIHRFCDTGICRD